MAIAEISIVPISAMIVPRIRIVVNRSRISSESRVSIQLQPNPGRPGNNSFKAKGAVPMHISLDAALGLHCPPPWIPRFGVHLTRKFVRRSPPLKIFVTVTRILQPADRKAFEVPKLQDAINRVK